MTAKPLVRNSNIVVQELKDEVLVYDLNVNKAFCLNETSALVWKLCDGRKTVSEISDELSKQLRELVNKDLVWLALDQFSKDGLLENGEELDNHLAAASRREMIRKLGLTSLIALPIVSSLVAPNAIAAQSCIPAGPFDISPQPTFGTCFANATAACCNGFSSATWVATLSCTGTCA